VVDPLLTLAIALYSINAAFFGFLSILYGRTALSTKARYPLGLFIFSILLLLQSAGTAVYYATFSGYFDSDIIPYMSVMGTFEFVGALTLLRITL